MFFSEYGEPAIGDFGIASLTTGPEGAQAVGVTLHYAAPEVLDDDLPSEMADIYSLGATLYTALAGRQPFRNSEPKQSAEAIRNRVLNEPLPPITEQPIPGRLVALLNQMLAKDPSARPRSAAEIQRTLRQLKGSNLGSISHDVTVPRSAIPTASAPSDAPPTPGEPIADDAPTTAIAPTPTPPPPPNNRARVAVLLTAAVVLSAIIGILLVNRSPEPTTGPSDTIPDFSSSTTTAVTVVGGPNTPSNIQFDSLDASQPDQQSISWSVVERAARYQVRITDQVELDGGGTTFTPRDPETTTEATLIFDAASNVGVCVEVRSLDAGGRTSDWSSQVCR